MTPKQLEAHVGQLIVQNDTQAEIITRKNRELLAAERRNEGLRRENEWLRAELEHAKNRKPTPLEIAEAHFGGQE